MLSLTLGLPREDFPLFLKWAPGISDGFNPDKTSKAWQNGGVAYGEWLITWPSMIKVIRRNPPAEPTILSLLNDAHAAGVISEDELIGQAVLLFAGSHETTLNLIGLSAYTFLRHPLELAKIQLNPALLESGIDEVLRFDGPGHMCDRRVSQEIELHGVLLKENDAVWLGLGPETVTRAVATDRMNSLLTARGRAAISVSAGVYTSVLAVIFPAWKPASPSPPCSKPFQAWSLPVCHRLTK